MEVSGDLQTLFALPSGKYALGSRKSLRSLGDEKFTYSCRNMNSVPSIP